MKICAFRLKIGSLFLLLCLFPSFIGAQTFSIEGAVKDQENSFIAGNALLLDAGGTKLLRGIFFENGAFGLSVDSTGHYVVRVSALGFSDVDFLLQVIPEKTKYQLGDIVLKEQAAELEAVTVTARKKMFEKTPDGTRFHVENTLLGKSANTAELLSKTPGVSIVGKKVNVFGRGEALLYLNGKEIPFETFSSLPPGEIKHLEIISNPSSKYDARAKAVVVITMKKSYQQGLLATLTEGFTTGFVPNARLGKHNMNNASLNLNLKKNRLALTSYYANDLGATWNENRFNTQAATSRGGFKTDYYYREDSKSKDVHYYRLGAGYEISDRSDVSFQYDGLRHYFELDVAQDGAYRAPDHKLTLISMRNAATTTLNNHSGNLNYSLRLDSSGGLFFAGIQYNTFENQLLDNISEAISNSETSLSKTYKINDGHNSIRLFTMQTDVEKNLPGGLKGSFGAKYYRISNEGKIRFLTRNEDEAVFSENLLFANGNLYKEDVPAAYILLRGGKNKWSYNAGLRGEYTQVNAFSKKLNRTIVDSSYFNLFPTVKINYQFSEHWNGNMGFARKINRPQYQNLDPFLWYLDSLTSIQGNPRLTPEFLNQLEWNLSWRSYNLKIGYTNSVNTLWSVIKPGATGENSTVFVQDNIQNRKIFLISLDIPVETKFYNAYNTIAYNFFKFEDSRPEYNTRASKPQFYVYSYHQFSIPKWLNFDITGEYFGPVSDGFTARKPYYYMTAGVSRAFFDKTLDLQLQFNDFLRTARFKGNRKINTFTSDYNQRFLSHYLRLTAVWKFGKMNAFRYNNKAINEKEFNRIKK